MFLEECETGLKCWSCRNVIFKSVEAIERIGDAGGRKDIVPTHSGESGGWSRQSQGMITHWYPFVNRL
jgi:hypothetical protein